MKSSNANCFSPFHKVKKLILCLRLLLGFPLSPVGNTLDQYKFDNLATFIKYGAFMIGAFLGGFYSFYLLYKATEISNPILAIKESFTGIGFSGLDIGVLIVISPINYTCNFLYLLSFKRGVSGINKISRHLTTLNEEFHNLLFQKSHAHLKNKCGYFFLYFRLIMLAILAMIAAGTFSYSWTKIVFRKYSSSFATGEKAAFSIIMFLLTLSYIYPPMMKSADFIVCYLLEETKDAFESLKLLLSQRKRQHDDRKIEPTLDVLQQQLRDKNNDLR